MKAEGMPLRALLAALLAVLLTACGQAATTSPAAEPTAAPAAAAATAAPAAAAAAPTRPTPGPGEFANPVIRSNFPDPHVLKVDDTYYAYATNSDGRNVLLARSADLVSWEPRTDAMPSLAEWVRVSRPDVWAPEVLQIGEQFMLYYTARHDESGRQCVGVAVADSPEGKFRDPLGEPLVCQLEEGGTIDAHPFRDADGTLYLYYKNDGNCCAMPTYLYAQELAPDGLSLLGEPVRLVRNDQSWEGGVVEAPTMWLQDGQYYLFFSGNDYGGMPYAVGYANCESALGPCEDAPENPILASDIDEQPIVMGPGHQTIVQDADGETWLVYHAWEITARGLKGQRRFVWIDQLVWENGQPRVEGPTRGPQPLP